MAYEIADFAADSHAALKAGQTRAALETVRLCLERLLGNEVFVTRHLGPDAAFGRETLYRDEALDFYLYARVPAIDFPEGARFARVTGTDLDGLPVRIFKDVRA